jgi:hypothetical protein
MTYWKCPYCYDWFNEEDDDKPPVCDMCRRAGKARLSNREVVTMSIVAGLVLASMFFLGCFVGAAL